MSCKQKYTKVDKVFHSLEQEQIGEIRGQITKFLDGSSNVSDDTMLESIIPLNILRGLFSTITMQYFFKRSFRWKPYCNFSGKINTPNVTVIYKIYIQIKLCTLLMTQVTNTIIGTVNVLSSTNPELSTATKPERNHFTMTLPMCYSKVNERV